MKMELVSQLCYTLQVFCSAARAAVIVETAITTRNCGFFFTELAASRHLCPYLRPLPDVR